MTIVSHPIWNMLHVLAHLKKVNDKKDRSGTGDQPVFKGVEMWLCLKTSKGNFKNVRR